MVAHATLDLEVVRLSPMLGIELTLRKKKKKKKTEAVFGKTQIYINLEFKFINLSYGESGHLPYSCTDFGSVSFTITHLLLP